MRQSVLLLFLSFVRSFRKGRCFVGRSMLFLLFLFLGALGTRVVVAETSCSSSDGKLTCVIGDCPVTGGVGAANVICTCNGSDQKVSCTFKLNVGSAGITCGPGTGGKTVTCKSGDQDCKVINCTETEKNSTLQLECECKGEGAQNQGKKSEGAQNQGKKAEGAQNQGKKAEGAQNQGKKSEGAQNQGKKGEGAQNADQLGEAQGTQNSTGTPSASEGNAKQSTQFEKMKGDTSAAARNSQEVAFLYPLFSFIAAMPRIN